MTCKISLDVSAVRNSRFNCTTKTVCSQHYRVLDGQLLNRNSFSVAGNDGKWEIRSIIIPVPHCCLLPRLTDQGSTRPVYTNLNDRSGLHKIDFQSLDLPKNCPHSNNTNRTIDSK